MATWGMVSAPVVEANLLATSAWLAVLALLAGGWSPELKVALPFPISVIGSRRTSTAYIEQECRSP